MSRGAWPDTSRSGRLPGGGDFELSPEEEGLTKDGEAYAKALGRADLWECEGLGWGWGKHVATPSLLSGWGPALPASSARRHLPFP